MPDNNVAIENALPRVDVRQKVVGSAKYAADQYRPNMVFAKFVRFPYGRGKAVSANVEKARRVPGVLEVDVRIDDYQEMPGGRIGHIVAESEAAIEDAIEALDLKFEHERPLTDANLEKQYNGPKPTGNHEAIRAKFKDAAVVVEALYQTQVQTHSCLEPHGSMVDHRGDEVEAWASTQDVTGYHDGLKGRVGNVPGSKVVVHSDYVGGGFGSKFGLRAEGSLAAQIATKYKRPCRVVLDRDEEHLDAGNRPGSIQYMQLAADKNGRILGGKVHCVSVVGFQRGGGGVNNPVGGLYKWGDIEKSEDEITLNFSIPRAFRAPGWPQGVFAVEGMMDELAAALGMDPVEFRQKNETSPRRARQLQTGAELVGWSERKPDGAWPGRVKRGYGVAGALWPKWPTPCEAECRIARDGTVEVRSGVQDIGTGTFTVVTDVACKALGLDRSLVSGLVGKSFYPPGPGSGGSVVSRSLVPAVREACANALKQMVAIVAAEWKVAAADVEYADGVFHSKSTGRKVPWKSVCGVMKDSVLVAHGKWERGWAGESDGSSDCVQFAVVDVDTETGIVRVRKIVAVHSAGEYVNRKTAENQICGGVTQGISYALFENRIQDRQTGAMVNADFLNYKIAGPVDIPDIVPVLDQDDSDTGVRSLGEPATVPTSGAIGNAIANALGVRVRSLPITPEKILAALEPKGASA
ncbi:MAG: hypothetical protein PWP23_650 [Candidatus Sumerlaeota bacterium]|nr:hypothetical protein [Candidatus Sumerlaeota bacterium]